MRHAARITLFVQDRDGKLDTFPDLEVLHALMRQVPLVTRNPDGTRTLVFDLADPAMAIAGPALPPAPDIDRLRAQIAAFGSEARALRLTLTAALADAAEMVAEAELAGLAPERIRD
ncbi:hypothetical protein [Falsiroseomonas oryzae]|uniref:hypothetical protein n=1 Tax=Falsiroseomonas oryzae TaxID=2766473 RepID=UPI0022EA46E5|nr:hypothetical protein [Roseomonas sp. MO-31]